MKNNDRVANGFASVGEPSSKYGMNPDQFTEDMQTHERKTEELYEQFKQFMLEVDASPDTFRYLFHRYYDEFIARKD